MARNFNGGTDRIQYPQSEAKSIGALSLWLKTTGTAGNTVPLAEWTHLTSRSGWGLLLNNSANKVGFVGYSASAQQVLINSSTSVNTGSWVHVAVNWDGASGQSNELFVNGASEVSANSSGAWSILNQSSSRLNIGRPDDTFWGGLVGDIAEVATWGRKLTTAEIAALSKGFSPIRMNPSYYAPLVRDHNDRRIGATTLAGSTTVSDHPRVLGGLV